MKRLITCISLICYITVLFSCSFGVKYELLHSCDEIAAIEIVKLLEPETENTGFKEEVLATVNNIDSFVEELTKIQCKVNYGEPSSMSVYAVVVRITYVNGDYELIDYDAQYTIFADRPGWQYGYHRLDKQSFKALIKPYYPKELPPSKSSNLVDESNNP